MIEFPIFSMMAFILTVAGGVYLIRKDYLTKKDTFSIVIFAVYMALLVKVAFFPIPYQKATIDVLREVGSGYAYNFIPLSSIINIVANNSIQTALVQVGGNFLLLMPLGFYGALIFPQKKIQQLLVVILSFSLTIEIIQFILGMIIAYQYRVVDVDDVILNLLGGIVGIGLGKLFSPLYNRILQKP